MSNSPLLAIPEISQNQVDKYVTHNDAVTFLEQATQRMLANGAVGGANWTLSEADFTRYWMFKASGVTGATRDLITPSTVDGNAVNRQFAVWNADDDQSIRVKAAGSGTTATLPPSMTGIFQQTGDDVTLIASVVLSFAYDIGFYVPEQPGDGVLVAQFVATRAFTLPDDFAGSTGFCDTNPSSSAVFDVKKNGSTVGSITISTLGAFTFVTTGTTVSFAAGDRLQVYAPSPQDGTLADISFTFKGSRT